MKLDEAQRAKVMQWIAEGLKLSDIQNRLGSEFGLRLTYMDTRLLVDDLKVMPKDVERPKTPAIGAGPAAASSVSADAKETAPASAMPTGGVSVQVDQVTRPGAVVSGRVTFSDGNVADWYFDQTGRLGLAPQQPGYRPPQADLQQFQTALDAELSKLGF